MTTFAEFNETYEKFRKTYEECSGLISNGIDLETVDPDMVRTEFQLKKLIEGELSTPLLVPHN